SLADQKIVFIEQNKNKLELQVNTAMERLSKIQFDLDAFKQQYRDQKELLLRHQQLIADAQHDRDELSHRYQALMQNRETVNQLHQQFDREVFDLEKQIAVLHHNADMIGNENRVLADEIARLQTEHAQLDEQLQLEGQKKEAASAALAALEEQEQNRLRTIRDLETGLTAEREQLRQLQRTLDSRSHEAELLKDMISNLEGFPESIKFLNKAQDWNVTAPLLSDIIYCDQAYRVMVEQILEPYLNYYVVRTWEEAARAIKLLNFAQKGRANFFILSEFDSSPETHAFSGLSPLLRHLRIEHGYEHLVQHLLHHVYISEGSPLELPHLNDLPADITIIDQQALMIRRAGQLAGGSIGLFEGKRVGRKQHLEHLEKEIVSLKREWHDLQNKVEHTQSQISNLQSLDFNPELQVRRSEVVNLLQSWAELNS
ncbi:MAG TPA: hypothetical protein VJ508_12785, partial [Saprospiraceae bacterium]|nr:hypothetical protein [Saprospiraceae bacterium]